MRKSRIRSVIIIGLAVWMAALTAPEAARERKEGDREGAAGARGEEFEANRLLEKAQDYLSVGENEKGMQMLQSIIDRWPASGIRFKVWMTMGHHAMKEHKWQDATVNFNRLQDMKQKDKELTGDDLELYLEALYQTGICFYQLSQYDAAFPVLRKITADYPNSIWANQSHYYIGMCHFAKENWNKAIEALSMVGTFVDFDSPTAVYAEAGRRFYVKITDDDLPVIKRLGRDVVVRLSTKSGDAERINMIPLTPKADIYIGSIPSEIGVPVTNDNKLSVLSGDKVSVTYVDENTVEGKANVLRTNTLEIVSSGGIMFPLSSSEEKAVVAFQQREQAIQVDDADIDTSPAAETVRVRVVSRYPKPKKSDDEQIEIVTDLDAAPGEEKKRSQEDEYEIRDEIMVTLTEVTTNLTTEAGAEIRTGKFRGGVMVSKTDRNDMGDKNDLVLSCALDDEIVATYVDALNIAGAVPREATASIKVSGEIDNTPTTVVRHVPDPDLRARKALVECQAFLELAKIFRGLGLLDGVIRKCEEGIDRADSIIREKAAIKTMYKEEAFKAKWELCLVMDDLDAALATCRIFATLFPFSGFADQALIRIGDVYVGKKKFDEALKIYANVIDLTNSTSNAEAQFKIAEVKEKSTLEEILLAQKSGKGRQGKDVLPPEVQAMMAAVSDYRRCAELYPDSLFASDALLKVVDFYVMTDDFAQADDMLEKVFEEYPDAKFLDKMLLKWVLVSFKRGDYNKAYEKCQQLLFDYPGSQYADTAKKTLPQIRKALNMSTE